MANTGNTQQQINYGAAANDGQGDPLRTAFIKTDDNFDNIWLAGPVGSNITIVNNTILANDVNGNIVLRPNGVGVIQANASVVPNAVGLRDLGSAAVPWRQIYADDVTAADITVSGNLTVDGDIIQIGNLVTDAKTIQLANTATTAAAANGSGITIGANDDIEFLYDGDSNEWRTNIGANVAGNIRAPYFIGNGSQLTGLPASYGNADVAAYLASGFGPFFSNTVVTVGNVVAQVVDTSALVNQFPIGIQTDNGYVWQFAGNILRAPEGGTWQSAAGTEYISSNANGFINLIAYSNSELATELFMEHGFIRLRVDNGGPEQDWNFNVDGTTDFPNYKFPAADGAAGEVLKTYGNGLLYWTTDSSDYGNANVAAFLTTYNGNLSADNISAGNVFTANLIPSANGVYSLGNSTNYWSNLWVASNTIYIGGVPLGITGNTLTVNGEPVGNVDADLPTYGGNVLVDYLIGNTTDNSGYLQWQGNSSGDLNGYTTLRLVPDDTLVANDQYLIIDPTSPSHIHIRAGGTQDASGAELFLGGEVDYVRVVDGSGVRLQNETRGDTIYNYSDPTDFNTGTWYESGGTYFVQYTTANAELITVTFQFNNDNQNTLLVTYNGGANTAELTSAGSVSNLGGGVYRVSVNEAPPASPTVISALEYAIWTTNTNSVVLQNNDFTVLVSDDVRITGNDLFSLRNESATEPITIRTDYNGADRVWEFGADGTLYTPGDIQTRGDIAGAVGVTTLVLRAEPASNTYIQLNASVDSNINTVANLEIRTDVSNNAKTWTFDTAGNLTLPGNISGTNFIVSESLIGSDASPQPTISGFSTISATGNITGGNLTTAGQVVATGNITGGNMRATSYRNASGVSILGNFSLTDNTIQTGNGVGGITLKIFGGDDTDPPTLIDKSWVFGNTGTFSNPGAIDATGNITGANLITTGNVVGNVSGFAIGYRDIPQVSFTGNATMAAADAGKHFYSTESTDYVLTIADNSAVTWPVGTTIIVVNRGTGNITVAQAAGVSLYLAGNSSAGNRTVTTYGMATVLNVAANVWMINGTGVS